MTKKIILKKKQTEIPKIEVRKKPPRSITLVRKKKDSIKPYSESTDEEKVERNWNKTVGLYERGEFSVSILRAATCIELAANFAIRHELITNRGLPVKFVDSLLKNANGLDGKIRRLMLPIFEDYEVHEELRSMWTNQVQPVATERNSVAHKGEFKSQETATEMLSNAQQSLVQIMKTCGRELKYEFKER